MHLHWVTKIGTSAWRALARCMNSRTCRKAQNQKHAMGDALGSSTVDLSCETETASNSSMPMAKRQAHSRPALQSFVCTAGQQDTFNKHLGRFFYRNNVALHLVEDHALKSAAATVGVTPPTQSVLSGPMLDTEFNLCKADVKLVDDSEFYALASEGYKRKTIESGVPLVNFMLLLPSGEAFFHKIIKAPGETKDAAWVWGQIYTKYHTRLELSRGEKMAYIRGNINPTELSEPSMFEEMDLALA
eukprot:363802-Chlamydomonas_euryale.AAC.3